MPLVIPPSGPWATIQAEWRIAPCRSWYESLARDGRIVRYDARGTGLSDRSSADFGLDNQVRDLATVIDHMGADRVTLFAAQHAGAAAIAYAAQNPSRVSRLVLWCTYARGIDYFAASQSQVLHSVRHRDWTLFTESIAHAQLGWEEGELAHQLAALLRESLTLELLDAFDAAAHDIDATPYLPSLATPTGIFHRRHVTHPDVSVAQRLAAHITGAQLMLLEGASVAPFVGDMHGAVESVTAFLSADEPRRPRSRSATREGRALVEPLTEREIEILRLIAQGLSNREVAQVLFLAVGTVKTHLNSAYGKLEVHSRTRALARARELGLLEAPE